MRAVVPPLLGLIALAGCGGGASVVSRGPDQIAVRVDAVDALEDAADEAADACDRTGRRADLVKTEQLEDGVVAYFVCR